MTTLPHAIGLSGFAGSGKTEAARYLESEYGYTRLHIADPLRDMLRTLLAWFDYDQGKVDAYLEGYMKESTIPALGVTSRHAQITLGTEWGRNLIRQDLWSVLWEHRAAKHPRAMNDSVRFPNEEQAIRRLGGITILIDRPGKHPAAFRWGTIGRLLYRFGIMWGVHDSERVDRLRPDHVILNDGSISDLHLAIDSVMTQFQHSRDNAPDGVDL